MAVNDSVLRDLRAAVGDRGWIDDPADMAPYRTEERGMFTGTCDAVVRPASTGEVARVVAICAAAGVPIATQGGNTSLCGGTVPDGGIVLSTARLNAVRAVDPVNKTITVEAGVILADVQRAAEEADALFPLSLAAEGSCRIGGNLSTNAGGVNVLRYGNARDLVLGLEVVLPDGRVWDGLRGLRKDNTGYDLKQLYLGSEGTLGIITAAVLKLFPRPRVTATALVALPDVDAVIDLFGRAQGTCGDLLTAFEMMQHRALDFAVRHGPDCRDPFAAPHPYYALVELTSPRAEDDLAQVLETVLGAAMEDGAVLDAVIAGSEGQRQDLWRIRESIPEAQKSEGASIKHDVSVPVSAVPAFMHRAIALCESEIPGVRPVAFGHVGDGNIHYNLSQPEGADPAAFMAGREAINEKVHDLVAELHGSFSAEHGVGQLKIPDMARYKSAVEVELMRRVKAALDPAGILNPGKVVPPA
ncbi:MAG: FAD-binding oxidoreductase [Hyphomicrobiales bacterium]|nr:FAD-binding oxidoreductase [Hyphomicrobiales bacterium]MCP5372534.1 FAD-binding oxidoreductase [Hyphomicrobiales bacterium]